MKPVTRDHPTRSLAAFDHGRLIARVVATLVALTGLASLLVPLTRLTHHISPGLLNHFGSPIVNMSLTGPADIIIGVGLLYVSYQLLDRRQVAWWITIVLLVGGALSRLIGPHHLSIIVYLGLLAAMIVSRDYFLSRSQPDGWKRAIFVILGGVIIAIGYGTIGFWLMDRRDFGQNFTLVGAFSQVVRSFFLLGDPTLIGYTRRADVFVDSLNTLGVTAGLVGLLALFQPLRYQLILRPTERARMRRLVERYGRSAEDAFKIWPEDKSFWFSHHLEAGFAYAVRGGVALTSGDPVGPPAAAQRAIAEFIDDCLKRGWLPAVIYADAKYYDSYRAAGMRALKIGEDAIVDLAQFVTVTARNKRFRNIYNRFTRDGYTFAYIASPPSSRLIDECNEVSAAWLRQPGRQEWGFITGYFDRAQLLQSAIVTLRDSSGQLVAFANELPRLSHAPVSIDLMRYRPDGPSGVMDFLFYQYFHELQRTNIERFSLGIAPLAGLNEADATLPQRFLNAFYHSPQPFIALQGLRQFKSKFEPEWQPRYAYVPSGPDRLPRVAIAFSRIVRR